MSKKLDEFMDKFFEKLAEYGAKAVLTSAGIIPRSDSDLVLDILSIFEKLVKCRETRNNKPYWNTKCLETVYNMIVNLYERYKDYFQK